MKKDEKNSKPKKSVHKLNIEDDLGDTIIADKRKRRQKTESIMDLEIMDDFEFEPDFESLGLFGDEFIEEPETTNPTHIKRETSASSGKKRIKKMSPSQEEIKEKKEIKKRRKTQNPEILMITYAFSFLFILMIGYFIYFNTFQSKEVINSPYNVRIDSFADSMIRGDIVSRNGAILAETLVDDYGNESRYYPYGNMFAHAIGTSEINQSGVELSHNFYLLQSNANPIFNVLKNIRGEKVHGDRIVTTLDESLQEVAYHALGYNDGAVIAIEPSTGKILAWVSKPDYDPNTLVDTYETLIADEENHCLMNKGSFGLFVPGSIFKSLTALSFLQSGGDMNHYHYQCTGQINLGNNDYITCFNQNVHGDEDLMDSFANSCNASFGNIGLEVGVDQLNQTCESMFFNKKLPTSIPHKKSIFSLDNDASNWSIAATAIGQGHTQVTPLHMAMLTSAIANGGQLMEPYMVDSLETSDGGRRIKKFLPVSHGQILDTNEVSVLTELMQAVVDYGTATSLGGYGYSVAGKTGTAEVSGKGDNSWFIGFAPVDQPEIAICVLVENDEGYYESALPVANSILQHYMNR